MTIPYVRKPYERVRSQLSFHHEVLDEKTGEILDTIHDDGRTEQHHAESCDVNCIIERYDRDGILPIPKRQGMYADVSNLNAYYGDLILESREKIATAEAFLESEKEKLAEAEKLKKEAEAEAARKSSTTGQQASDSAPASDS